MEGLKTSSSSSVSFIRDILEEHEMQAILLSETWLREHLDAEVNIPGYSIFRSDRVRTKKRRGRNSGGTAIYLKNDIAASSDVQLQYSSGVIESICLGVPKLNLAMCAVYRQPDDPVGGNKSTSTEFQIFLDSLSEVLDKLPTPTPNLLIAGDFNLPKADWPSCIPRRGATADEKRMINMLSDFNSRYFLTQIVTQPTHQAGNTLDLILTNNDSAFSFENATPTYPISSHYFVKASCMQVSQQELHQQAEPCLSGFDALNLHSDDTNWAAMEAEIDSVDWTATFMDLSVEEMLTKLTQTCQNTAMENAPRKARRQQPGHSKVPRHRRILMRKRTRLRKQLHNSHSESRRNTIRTTLVDIEQKLQESHAAQERHDESKAVDAIKKNPKFFYSYAKKRSKIRYPIGPLEDTNGNLCSNPIDMANILSNQYKNAFSVPATTTPDFSTPKETRIEDIDFNEEHISKAIDEISATSSPGPDRFPAIILKKCKKALCKPLYMIWRKSLDTGEIPLLLKSSVVIPVYKGGSKQHAKNYRPVALTSHLVKLFEKILRNYLVQFIETNDLLNPSQHGFRSGHSCLSQLLHHFDLVTKLLENGQNVDVIYLDFSKAFDKLDIMITLQKLFNLGVTGKLFDWIKSFLTHRKQSVYVDGRKSKIEAVVSGVPQGSVLGPLMFLIMLGDINEDVTATVSSFADDTRVLSGVASEQDTYDLQSNLNRIYLWADKNNASFNPDKFECLRYGYDQELKANTSYQSTDGADIGSKPSVRDLGVRMSDNASFAEQIADIVMAANQKAGWILRTFKTRAQTLMITLWKSLVMPLLDYCSQLWSPSSPGLIQSIEKVQVSYLNKVQGMSVLTYWEQIKQLKMYSLERRRERYRIVYMWKVLEGMVPNFGVEVSYNKRRGRYCVVPAIRSAAPCRIQTIRFGSMGVNGPRLFNSLPVHLRNMSGCSLNSFKRSLDHHLASVPDQPRVPGMIRYCTRGSNSLVDA